MMINLKDVPFRVVYEFRIEPQVPAFFGQYQLKGIGFFGDLRQAAFKALGLN